MKSNAPVRFTRPAKVVAPVAVAPDCVKLAALNVLEADTKLADVTVTAPRRVAKAGVTPPTAPVKVMSPVPAVRPRSKPPSSVLPKVMLPMPAPVFIKMLSVNVTPVAKEIKLLVVVMSPPRKLRPAPSCKNLPAVVMFAPLAVVNRPALVTSIVVPTTFVPTPLMLRS